jgi:hypothetical protein
MGTIEDEDDEDEDDDDEEGADAGNDMRNRAN